MKQLYVQKRNKSHKFLYIGGGTAGHIYPIQALIEVFTTQYTDKSHFTHIILTDQRGVKFCTMPKTEISPINRKRIIRTFFSTIIHSWKILSKHKPDIVFTFGGYVCVIPALLAKLRRIPLVVIETNAILGRSSKFLSRFAFKCYSSFAIHKFTQVGFIARSCFTTSAVSTNITTPNPSTTTSNHSSTLTSTSKPHILIMGSSIGTQLFVDLMPKALKNHNCSIVHQAPQAYHQQLLTQYTQTDIKLLDYIYNIHEHMQQADLIICRAGASTIAELAALRKKCILIPYAKAKDNHQVYNAKAFGATYIEEHNCTPEKLSILIANPQLPTSKISNNGALNIWTDILSHYYK